MPLGTDPHKAQDALIASIPLCNVFADTFPKAEIVLIGVEEPQCLIHAPNESVHPTEIARMAEAEARFLRLYGAG